MESGRIAAKEKGEDKRERIKGGLSADTKTTTFNCLLSVMLHTKQQRSTSQILMDGDFAS